MYYNASLNHLGEENCLKLSQYTDTWMDIPKVNLTFIPCYNTVHVHVLHIIKQFRVVSHVCPRTLSLIYSIIELRLINYQFSHGTKQELK